MPASLIAVIFKAQPYHSNANMNPRENPDFLAQCSHHTFEPFVGDSFTLTATEFDGVCFEASIKEVTPYPDRKMDEIDRVPFSILLTPTTPMRLPASGGTVSLQHPSLESFVAFVQPITVPGASAGPVLEINFG